MALDTLIRVVQGNNVREIRLSALLGKYVDRIQRAKGGISIEDPELEKKLSPNELERLYKTEIGKHLNPNRELPPKPSEKPVEFRNEKVEVTKEETKSELVEEVTEPKEEVKTEPVEESTGKDVNDMTVPELKKYLTANAVKFDGRRKKKDYYLKLATKQK